MWKTIGLSSRTAVHCSGGLVTNAVAVLRARVPTGFPSSTVAVPATIQRVGFQLRCFVGSRARLSAEASTLATRGTRTRTASSQTGGTRSAGTKKAVTQKKATTITGTTRKAAGGTTAPKTAKKIKSPAKEAAPKGKKKTLTPEEELKKRITALKKESLSSEEPESLAINSWAVFLAEKKRNGVFNTGVSAARSVSGYSLEYKELEQAEVERMAAIAAHNRETNKQAFQAWVASKTPAEIAEANKARVTLSRLTKVPRRLIEDDRLPKRPPSAFALYFRSKMEQGRGDKTAQQLMKQVGAEWKALTDAEKEPFVEKAAALFTQYEGEQETLGIGIRRAAV